MKKIIMIELGPMTGDEIGTTEISNQDDFLMTGEEIATNKRDDQKLLSLMFPEKWG